ncbi:MAG: livF [Enterovirga sp.]|jgi:branched-chain amino acid transport system ATP-binding protein|nr:livF [Enterovirga sp.]
MTPSAEMLSVENVTAGYGDATVLFDASFSVREREIVAIVGANGAGKTTLLSTIVGLVQARTGRISFRGRDITRRAAHLLPGDGLALVPEGGRLFPFMTVEENLLLGAYSPDSRTKRKERLQEMMELFPILGERRALAAGKLSGGERQMCAIARALMSHPVLIMLDEPSVGLSPLMVERVFTMVETLAREKGLTIVLVEQNVTEALEVSDRAYVLDHGHVVRGGEAAILRNDREIQETYMGL